MCMREQHVPACVLDDCKAKRPQQTHDATAKRQPAEQTTRSKQCKRLTRISHRLQRRSTKKRIEQIGMNLDYRHGRPGRYRCQQLVRQPVTCKAYQYNLVAQLVATVSAQDVGCRKHRERPSCVRSIRCSLWAIINDKETRRFSV